MPISFRFELFLRQSGTSNGQHVLSTYLCFFLSFSLNSFFTSASVWKCICIAATPLQNDTIYVPYFCIGFSFACPFRVDSQRSFVWFLYVCRTNWDAHDIVNVPPNISYIYESPITTQFEKKLRKMRSIKQAEARTHS